ncbi:hypothetical protein [Rhizobium rhizogenes]|uniref:hypothetical protein n=1 Tax=Rhizobium rhizogenes TaxID=359 RepID=UPI00226D8E2A|nr:hypothetical protein [Rhizobium rhizogenes]
MSFRGDEEGLPHLPPDQIGFKFLSWNGDGAAPKLSHRMSEGTITIRAVTPRSATEVLWNGERIGFDVIWVELVLRNIVDKKYDKDFGFPISEKVPHALDAWNDL